MFLTQYGPYEKTIVLDGVFLATTGAVLNSIQLSKPKKFTGEWDFYDIFYTFQAHLKGFNNKVIPLNILHKSLGKPRDSWDLNRQAFIELFDKHLPCVIN
jgi:hypothetical protein